MKQIEVVAAVILHEGRIFATQRGYGEWKDWWEFSGGKMELGETPEVTLGTGSHASEYRALEQETKTLQK